MERIAPDLPPGPGQVAKLKFEYRRHGTISLFGNFHVPTGQLASKFVDGPAWTRLVNRASLS